MSICEETRKPVNLDTLFEELNKLGTSASLKLVDAIEEHTEYHLDPSDGYLRDNCPSYKGAIPIAEVSRNFNIDIENVYIYVYILERHVVFVTTDVKHDCVGKAAAVPVTEIYSLTRLLDRLGVNVDGINHLMKALIMSGKEGWVYVRKFTQRRTKFYEEGMKGVATMLDKKVIGSLAACVKALDQVDNQNGLRNPTDRIFADIPSAVFYLNMIGMNYARRNATVTIDGTGKDTTIYAKYIDEKNQRININFFIREIDIVSQSNIFRSGIDDDPNRIIRFFTPTEEIKAYDEKVD